jgi:NADH:ubiquinone oxidoreductase subunit H
MPLVVIKGYDLRRQNILQLKTIQMMIITFIISILLALVIIAFFTLAELKVIGSVQRRRGPNVVGI